jgi:hypothetical protein
MLFKVYICHLQFNILYIIYINCILITENWLFMNIKLLFFNRKLITAHKQKSQILTVTVKSHRASSHFINYYF